MILIFFVPLWQVYYGKPINVQHDQGLFSRVADPYAFDLDPGYWWPKIEKMYSWKKIFFFPFQNMKFLIFFYFCGSFLPSWIRMRISHTDPDPLTWLNWIRIRDTAFFLSQELLLAVCASLERRRSCVRPYSALTSLRPHPRPLSSSSPSAQAGHRSRCNRYGTVWITTVFSFFCSPGGGGGGGGGREERGKLRQLRQDSNFKSLLLSFLFVLI